MDPSLWDIIQVPPEHNLKKVQANFNCWSTFLRLGEPTDIVINLVIRNGFVKVRLLDWITAEIDVCAACHVLALPVSMWSDLNSHKHVSFSLLSQIFYPLRTHVNYSAVWGHPPIQRQNRNAKKLTTEKLSKSRLRSVISLKYWSSQKKNQNRNRKSARLKKFCSTISIILQRLDR